MVEIWKDLEELNIPVYAEGDAPASLPDEYFTFNEDYTSDLVSASNEPQSILYEFTLKYYTKNAETLYSTLIAALRLLSEKGYITSGVGYANATYHDTWFSRQADIKKIHYIQEEEQNG